MAYTMLTKKDFTLWKPTGLDFGIFSSPLSYRWPLHGLRRKSLLSKYLTHTSIREMEQSVTKPFGRALTCAQTPF